MYYLIDFLVDLCGWSKTNVDNMSKLRAMQANKQDIRIVTRNKLNMDANTIKQLKENTSIRKTVNKNIKYTDMRFTVPAMTYGDREMRIKLKELLDYKIG